MAGQSKVHHSEPSKLIVSDSPLEVVNYQLNSIPLQIPQSTSIVSPVPYKEVDLTEMIQKILGRISQLEVKQTHLEGELDTKWSDAM